VPHRSEPHGLNLSIRTFLKTTGVGSRREIEQAIAKDIASRVSVCEGCDRVFWEGTHWRHMRELVDSLLPPATPVEEPRVRGCFAEGLA
jgi:Family of unknown function (DUF6494)/Mut7-C RNAse domain